MHVTGSIGRHYSDRMDFYTAHEFHAFYEAVKDKPQSKIIFPLLFYSGIREGEMLALTQADFDYKNQTLTINKTYSRVNKKDIITEPKTPTSNRKIKIPAFIFEQPSLSSILAAWAPILYAGVLSCGVGYTLQIIGQKGMNPTIASLILSLESAISVLAGWLILGQTLSARELAGCAIVFLAIVLAQLPWPPQKNS